MDTSNRNEVLDRLLQKDSRSVRHWLDNVWSGREQAPPDFNWLGLAEGATFRSHDRTGSAFTQSDMEWAEISILIRERLADTYPERAESLDLNVMMLRARMIRDHGARKGHPVLDSDTVITWFLNSVSMPLSEAIALSSQAKANLENVDIETARALRRLKNRVRVIEVLSERSSIHLPNEVSQWISAREKLL